MTGLRGNGRAASRLPATYKCTERDYVLMRSWLNVMAAVGIGDVRTLAVLAMPTFAGRACIACEQCSQVQYFGQTYHQRMTITAAVEHLRTNAPAHRHHLVLNANALAVTK